MDFFKGWHKPTVATAAVIIVGLLIFYHLAFHVAKNKGQ